MTQYRIKIKECNDSTFVYTPQVRTTSFFKQLFSRRPIKWETIIRRSNGFITSKHYMVEYKTENEALEVINQYKKYLDGNYNRRAKSVKYKMIE